LNLERSLLWDLDLEALGGACSLGLFSRLSGEEPEFEPLSEGLGLGSRLSFLLSSLSFPLPLSLPLLRNFAMGDLSGEPWGCV